MRYSKMITFENKIKHERKSIVCVSLDVFNGLFSIEFEFVYIVNAFPNCLANKKNESIKNTPICQ